MNPADKEVLSELWRRKNAFQCAEYIGVALADLSQDVEMHVWNGKHPVEKNTTYHTAKAGTTVLIWAVSRFGDVGVTDQLEGAHGYHARVDPEILTNWRFKSLNWMRRPAAFVRTECGGDEMKVVCPSAKVMRDAPAKGLSVSLKGLNGFVLGVLQPNDGVQRTHLDTDLEATMVAAGTVSLTSKTLLGDLFLSVLCEGG